MQASNVSTPTAEHNSTIFVAIELSQKSWLVMIHSPDRDYRLPFGQIFVRGVSTAALGALQGMLDAPSRCHFVKNGTARR